MLRGARRRRWAVASQMTCALACPTPRQSPAVSIQARTAWAKPFVDAVGDGLSNFAMVPAVRHEF